MPKQPGLDDRHRDENGQTRAKNSNTRIDTLRQIYGEDSRRECVAMLTLTRS